MHNSIVILSSEKIVSYEVIISLGKLCTGAEKFLREIMQLPTRNSEEPFIPYPAEPVVSLLYENNHLDGNIVEHVLNKKEASELYDLFITALRNRVVKECKDNAVEYVTSLTTYTDTNESACQIKCKTLAKKLWYTIQAKTENVRDYTNGWFKALAE